MMKVLKVLCADNQKVTYLHLKTTLIQQFGQHAFARHKPEIQKFVTSLAEGAATARGGSQPQLSVDQLEQERAGYARRLKKLWASADPDQVRMPAQSCAARSPMLMPSCQAEEARLVERMAELRSRINALSSAAQPPPNAVAAPQSSPGAALHPSIEALDDALLCEVFRHLPGHEVVLHAAAVSRRWRRATASTVGCRMDLRWARSRLTDAVLRRSILPCIGCVPLQPPCAAGSSLDAYRRPRAAIDLRGCQRLSNAGCAAVAAHSPGLLEVALDGCVIVGEPGVAALAIGCPNLRTASLAGLSLPETAVVRLADGCRGLRRLNMRAPEGERSSLGLSAAAALASHTPGLRAVDFGASARLDEEVLRVLAAGCGSLEELRVAGCPAVTDGALAVMGQLPQLRRLDVSQCRAITDAAVCTLARRCPALVELRLAGCRSVTDAAVTAVAAGLPQLAALDLSRCSAITDEALRRLAARRGGGGLFEVRFGACDMVCDGGLAALARAHGGTLASLDLGRCLLVSTAAIVELGRLCPRLVELVLAGCPNATDDAVLAVAESCPDLRVLGLGSCSKLTSSGVAALIHASRALEELALDDCTQLNQSVLDAAHAAMRPSRLLTISGVAGLDPAPLLQRGVRVISGE